MLKALQDHTPGLAVVLAWLVLRQLPGLSELQGDLWGEVLTAVFAWLLVAAVAALWRPRPRVTVEWAYPDGARIRASEYTIRRDREEFLQLKVFYEEAGWVARQLANRVRGGGEVLLDLRFDPSHLELVPEYRDGLPFQKVPLEAVLRLDFAALPPPAGTGWRRTAAVQAAWPLVHIIPGGPPDSYSVDVMFEPVAAGTTWFQRRAIRCDTSVTTLHVAH